jgi:hypothetical protein
MITLILTKEKDLSFIYGQWLLLRRVFPRANGKLENLLKVLSAILLEEIPMFTEEDKRLFNLLKKAYVDARYKKSYSITKDELAYLSGRVEKLRTLT